MKTLRVLSVLWVLSVLSSLALDTPINNLKLQGTFNGTPTGGTVSFGSVTFTLGNTELPAGKTFNIDTSSNFNLGGSSGVRLTGGGGVLNLLGLGTGADESLIIDFDDVPNTIGFSTGSGATDLNFGSFIITAGQFIGGGAGLTDLDAGDISAGTLPVARGGTGVTTSTGSGNTVLSTSPTLTTPAISAPAITGAATFTPGASTIGANFTLGATSADAWRLDAATGWNEDFFDLRVNGNQQIVGNHDGTLELKSGGLRNIDDTDTGFNLLGSNQAGVLAGNRQAFTFGAGLIYFGSATHATPQNGYMYAEGGSGTNIAGGAMYISGGVGTGSATSGKIVFQTHGVIGGSGTTPNTLAERLAITPDGTVVVGASTAAGTGKVELPSSTSATAGIALGDVNLYRSAANTLKTDDSLIVGGTATLGSFLVDAFTASTQANVAIKADDGSTSNISLVLTPKGTGSLLLGPKPDGTSTGGNARGSNAIDLQIKRDAATKVASGANSVLIGNQGIASGPYSTAIGYNAASTGDSSITIGVNSTASGSAAVSIGSSTVASGAYSFSHGQSAESSRIGMRAFSGAAYISGAAGGSTQGIEWTASDKTTNATPSQLFLDGVSGSTPFVLRLGTGIAGILQVQAMSSDGATHAIFRKSIAAKRVTSGDTMTLTQNDDLGTQVAAGCAITITADATDKSLKIMGTGIAATTIIWTVSFYGLETEYAR